MKTYQQFCAFVMTAVGLVAIDKALESDNPLTAWIYIGFMFATMYTVYRRLGLQHKRKVKGRRKGVFNRAYWRRVFLLKYLRSQRMVSHIRDNANAWYTVSVLITIAVFQL